MNAYRHRVQYYETDMMGVAHHANYVRWMEEARVDFMDQMGYPYARMEKEGVRSPVKALSCEYRHPCTFGDVISVQVAVESFNGVVMAILYTMRNEREEVVCEARSEHVFLNREGRFVRMKRDMADFCRAIEETMLDNSEG